jgi:hypothetical protein
MPCPNAAAQRIAVEIAHAHIKARAAQQAKTDLAARQQTEQAAHQARQQQDDEDITRLLEADRQQLHALVRSFLEKLTGKDRKKMEILLRGLGLDVGNA